MKGILFREDVCDDSISRLRRKIYNDCPDTIAIETCGGDFVPARDLYEEMVQFRSFGSRIFSVHNSSFINSAGIILFLCANQQKRFACPNSTFFIHNVAHNKKCPHADTIRWRHELWAMLSGGTRLTYDEAKKMCTKSARLNAQQAKEIGLITDIRELDVTGFENI